MASSARGSSVERVDDDAMGVRQRSGVEEPFVGLRPRGRHWEHVIGGQWRDAGDRRRCRAH
ncbi:hypothetical protein MUK42_36541 [Musa troglodytarum]|uniref:Uncharacterized protein n=1 Tax=Musa troglodytarum TaxID=320322 RepID=A0A9E7EDX7_9LILI|nr:hypothetical protein MUK42_36541 [Musa troglodytarum]